MIQQSGRIDANMKAIHLREHSLQALRTRHLWSEDLQPLFCPRSHHTGAFDETEHEASVHRADKELKPCRSTHPMLKDVNGIGIWYLIANKVDDPGVVNLGDGVLIVPVQDMARFTLDKREPMCICMEFLLSASHVHDHVWLPRAKGNIAFSAWDRCIRGGPVHLERCRTPWLALIPINIRQRSRLVIREHVER
jgi:hypothetical protein